MRHNRRMALLGPAALLLSFDVAPEAIAGHDDWHTREHLPERLSIPGFLRGTRWTALHGAPRYFVMYEVASLATLSSPAYLERLNHPTPWTSTVMASYRGMRRAFCTVAGSAGHGLGGTGRLIRFAPPAAGAEGLRDWLVRTALPALAARAGLGSAHLFEPAAAPAMTREQRIRGADAALGCAILVTGHDEDALERVAEAGVGARALHARGATDVVDATYRLHYALLREELRA